jgi:hypothetical protein
MKLGLGAGIAGLLCLALAGCGGGPSASSASSVQQQARVVWLDYARCVRAHGYPSFPDPQVNSQGKAAFGGSRTQNKSIGQQLDHTCGPILRRLPATALGRTPVTPAVLHQERLFAACLRRNGLPQWPDPRSDGTFPLAQTPYATMGKSGPVLTGLQACRQYDTFGGIEATRP